MTLRGTHRFQDGTLAATTQSAAGRSQASGTYETDGALLIWTVSCPQAVRHTMGYTGTESEVTLYDSGLGELTFTRQ